MNLSVQSGVGYINKLIDFEKVLGEKAEELEIVIFPDFLSLYKVNEMLKRSSIKTGAQDCFWETRGAYTGEISPLFLKEAGCKYILLGHPERIINLKETPEMMARKLKTAMDCGLKPFLIIYEKPDVKKEDVPKQLIDDLMVFIGNLSSQEISKMILIYEPLWAIGTDKAAATSHIREVVAKVREFLSSEFRDGLGEKIPIKYGGGVTAASSKDIIAIQELDGIGMGRAGLDIGFFTSTIKDANDMLLKSKKDKGR
jgi:triosephosphate isomerase